jgi:hypothetical protein
MTSESPYERLQQEIRSRKEEISMYERIYNRGAGCFGVGRKSPEIKKKLKELKKL